MSAVGLTEIKTEATETVHAMFYWLTLPQDHRERFIRELDAGQSQRLQRIANDRDISPKNLQRLLKASQHWLDEQLASIISQIQRQSDSTFGGQTWAEASWPGLAGCLIRRSKALAEL